MPRLAKGIHCPVPLSVGQQQRNRAAAAKSDAIGIAAGCSLQIPSLNGSVIEYPITDNWKPLASVSKTLLKAGIAKQEDWRGDPEKFLEASLARFLSDHGSEWADQFVEVHVGLSSALAGARLDHDAAPDVSAIWLTVEATAYGLMLLGPTLDVLASVDPQIASTYYRQFMNLLTSWGYAYSLHDAKEALERMEEMRFDDDEPGFEAPDVKSCEPNFLKLDPAPWPACISKMPAGQAREIASGLHYLERISGSPRRPYYVGLLDDPEYGDMTPPVPFILAAMHPSDGICACFDWERDGWNGETDHEPMFIRRFDATNIASTKKAFAALARFVETMAALAKYLDFLPGALPKGG